ncbi:MAG: hypothetical protein KGL39_09225 [Patescibacteria group bacterium]|nr:hypothetical protein [Patescibacteria group bacterium]
MSRAALQYVIEIGPEVALPLAHAHCARYQQAYDDEAGLDMFWAGAVLRNSVRAVVGLAALPSAFFVTGIFTDGSPYEYAAAKLLAERINELPCDLVGRLHLPSLLIRRLFRKNGWNLLQGVV